MVCESCGHDNLKLTLYCEQCGANLYKAKLRVIHEDGLNRTHYLFSKPYTIGRGPDNDIVIPDASVSRHHVKLQYNGGAFSIEDRDSKNGSLLNNLEFNRGRLKNQDCIQLGSVVLHYYDDMPQSSPVSNYDTMAFVQKAYTELAENRERHITTSDVLNTTLDLLLSLLHADQAAILTYDRQQVLEVKIGKNFDDTLLQQAAPLFDKVMAGKAPHLACRDQAAEWDGDLMHEPDWEKIIFPLLATKGDTRLQKGLGKAGVLGLCYLDHRKQRNPLWLARGFATDLLARLSSGGTSLQSLP